MEQKVGKLPRQIVSRAETPAVGDHKAMAPRKTIQKALTHDEKRLRALNKLLRQIEELRDREIAL